MRILYVSPEVPGAGGAGIATYISEATAALAARGHECHVLTWRGDIDYPRVTREPAYVLHEFPEPDAKGDRFEGVDTDLRTSAAVAEWVIELQRQQPFDIIEGTDWKAPLYCLLQQRNVEPALQGCRVVVFNHGDTYAIVRHEDSFIPRAKYQRINLEHQCLNLADTVICPSHAARATLIELHNVAAERIEVVPEPLATDALPAAASVLAPPRTLLYYGSITVSKGVQSFVQIANRFEACGTGWTVEFVGPVNGLARGAPLFKRDIVRALAIEAENVEFTGRLPRDEALSRIGAHHILVNMSKRETFCYAFVEGLLRGAVPLALAGSAQAEFLPPALRDTFSVGAAIADIGRFEPAELLSAWDQHADEVRDYARKLTRPDAYATAYERLATERQTPLCPARQTWSSAPVSVLIPAHEPDGLLLETIASVRGQSSTVAEIVVGDDGSRAEASRAVLAAAAEQPGVRVVHMPWAGLAETRNRLLKECRTPLFAFVDADDLLEPGFIGVSREYLAANFDAGVRSVQGWYELFGTQTGVRGPVIFQHFSHALWNDLKNNILGVTEVFRDLGYNADLVGGEAEDWEFWLRYFRQGWQVRIVPAVLWRYRRHAGALSARWSEAMSVGTARANARVFGSRAAASIPPHAWDFIGEYMYLGEAFYQQHQSEDAGTHKDIRKIESRLTSLNVQGEPMTLRQRTAVRLMRHLSRSLQ